MKWNMKQNYECALNLYDFFLFVLFYTFYFEVTEFVYDNIEFVTLHVYYKS